ncbi:hypothetical protein LPJ66_003096 [Kickxella alabastrina]|uniref:Uncharacterized protein n=1 Tax=Kickxella alabastrina TaxID=61397 RepID=A0ACC1ILL8_9FUNG|nr:hypothetical protein LPJ66_003096 [Kickxella alabastrina]
MEQIRYVKIPLVETRTDPDTHVEYALNVQGPVRSWTVWHRYNDFLTLAYELNREFPNTPTPLQLPPKTLTSWFSKITTVTGNISGNNSGNGGTNSSLEFIEERRHALERYIQGMIMSEDDRWRESTSLQRFLAPVTKGAKYLAGKNSPKMSARTGSETGSMDSDMGWVTPASWLNEHRDAEQIVRDVRQSILRRENALTRNEVSVSHQSLLQAKRQLADLGRVLKVLEQGLEQTKGGLTAGEVLRRQDMMMRLAEERANLSRIVMGTSVMSGSGERAALLSGTSLDNNNNTRVLGRAGNGNSSLESRNQYGNAGAMTGRPNGSLQEDGSNAGATANGSSRVVSRSRRIFGNSNPPQETNETRGFDNKGLLMLQTDRMREQDQVAADFSALLRRQREMGVAIGNELDLQNQLLTELDQDMDRTGNKISAARRQANRFT